MNANSADEAFSLFIDGLPWEMNWSWLLQIFIGEGEVSDVYVSHKRRRFNNSKFGFVRFKKLEEATNAVNNLNGRVCFEMAQPLWRLIRRRSL